MKKFILGLLIAVLVISSVAGVAQAAPPSEEEWTFCEARNGLIRGTYLINTTNLKTSEFWVYNETEDIYAIPYVLYNGEEVWRVIVEPNSVWSMKYTVNFRRLPATDPDDPDSIRYPQGYTFGMWTGKDPNSYPPPQ